MQPETILSAIHKKATQLGMNPLLLLAGIEGLYSFKNVPLNAINYDLLDNLILTIFALRIGEQFHTIAAEEITGTNEKARVAASRELLELSSEQIQASNNQYLISFSQVLAGKSPVRVYHIKALEVAALEIGQLRMRYNETSVGSIILQLCKSRLYEEEVEIFFKSW
jgi:hypothetical protein